MGGLRALAPGPHGRSGSLPLVFAAFARMGAGVSACAFGVFRLTPNLSRSNAAASLSDAVCLCVCVCVCVCVVWGVSVPRVPMPPKGGMQPVPAEKRGEMPGSEPPWTRPQGYRTPQPPKTLRVPEG